MGEFYILRLDMFPLYMRKHWKVAVYNSSASQSGVMNKSI